MLLALALGAVAAPLGARADEGPFLHVIPTTLAPGATLPDDGPWRVAVHTPDAEHLARALSPCEDVEVGERLVRVDFGRCRAPTDPPTDADLRSSFLVDHEEPAVAALVARARTALGDAPEVPALVRFVAEAIPKKTAPSAWDAASRVAARGQGDCTEHAVLLAALARAFGRPARIAVGWVLAEAGGRPASYGHAWTEIHDGDAWRTADATLAGDPSVRAYLRVGRVREEGPGFGLALIGLLQSLRVEAVEVLGAGTPR